MRNADMPAIPVVLPDGSVVDGMGLTKREYIAALAMQAMIANPEWETEGTVSEDAVYAADALLAELERTK
jgi:hypothetical protein